METLWPARETFFWHTRPPFFSASKKWDRSRLRRCCQLQCSSTDGSAARTFLDRLFNKSRDRSDAFRSVANTGSAASEHSLHRQEVQALQLWQASPPPRAYTSTLSVGEVHISFATYQKLLKLLCFSMFHFSGVSFSFSGSHSQANMGKAKQRKEVVTGIFAQIFPPSFCPPITPLAFLFSCLLFT